jgi:hypothetical protein
VFSVGGENRGNKAVVGRKLVFDSSADGATRPDESPRASQQQLGINSGYHQFCYDYLKAKHAW